VPVRHNELAVVWSVGGGRVAQERHLKRSGLQDKERKKERKTERTKERKKERKKEKV
jgi:hypothetical protein